jgi:DNA sulfur modification protein DndB
MAISEYVVKSKMRETEFFTGSISWAAVKNSLLPPDDPEWDSIFGKNDDDSSGAQRKLNRKRVEDAIVPYLLNTDSPFFSSLTLMMVPMDGSILQEGVHYTFEPLKGGGIGGTMGELKLADHVRLFIADGQHRAEAIRRALAVEPSMATQRVPVIFLPYKAREQVKQFFADLNLNAKPVNKSIGYAYESRDPVVIMSKRVAHEVPLFRGRVNELTNSLSARSTNVITLNTLMSANTDLMLAYYKAAKLDTLKKLDPIKRLAQKPVASDEVLLEARPLIKFWEAAVANTPGWSQVMLDPEDPNHLKPGEVRDGKHGALGHVSAYGIGWQAMAKAMAALIRATRGWNASAPPPADPLAAFVDCIKKVDWKKGTHWNGIAMIGTRVNNTAPGVRATAAYILKQGGFVNQNEELEQLQKTLEDSLQGMAQAEAAFAAHEESEEPTLT